MNLNDVRQIRVPRKARKRVGRGQGSGWGTTSGRGNKGAGQRAGTTFRLHFEGGQMPLYRRLPKMGFTNAPFRLRYHVVNVSDLDARFASGAHVDLEALKAAGLAPKNAKHLKVLGWGEITKPVRVRAHAVSAGARTKIEGAAGSIELISTRPEMRPKGVAKTRRAKGAEGAAS
jgi:large subunit ribosomal protein L15